MAPAICYARQGDVFLSSDAFFADAGYQGPKMAKVVAATGAWILEIVKRSDLHPKAMDRGTHLRLDPSKPPPHAQALDQAKPLLMNLFSLDQH